MTKCSKYLDQSQNNYQSLDRAATGHHVVWGDDVVDILEEMKNTKEGEDDEEEEEEEEDKEDVESDELTVEEEMEIQRRWVPTSNELVFTCLRLLLLSYKGTETYLICFTKRLAVEPRAGFSSEREGWPGCTGVSANSLQIWVMFADNLMKFGRA